MRNINSIHHHSPIEKKSDDSTAWNFSFSRNTNSSKAPQLNICNVAPS